MATNQDVAQRAVNWLHLNGDIFNDPQSTMPTRAELLEYPVNQLNVQHYAERMSQAKLNNVRKLATKTFGVYQVHDKHRKQIFTESGGVFWPVVVVQSYNAKIANIVINMYTRKVELWLTQHRYSSTTDRHMSKVRSAFLHATRYNNDTTGTTLYRDAEIYETYAVETQTDRVSSATLRAHIEIARTKDILHTAINPKVHEPTRRGAVTATSWRLQTLRRHLAYDTPYEDTTPQATPTTHHVTFFPTSPTGGKLRMDALQEIDAMLAFTTRLTQTDANPVPIANLRAQVEAYFALEGNHG